MQLKSGVDYQAYIVTSLGTINIDLFEKETPIAVNNFVFLAKDGFYTGLKFQRVIKGQVIQGGDPNGNSTGGPGYKFNDEILSTIKFAPYVVAYANSGANSNGSQFFITTKSNTSSNLDGKYTIFGRVVNGFDIVDKIENVPVNVDKPLTDVVIQSVNIVEK